MTTHRIALGSAGEAAAERHLRSLGYNIVARNLRLGRMGELDLVALDRETLVFAEVKTKVAGEVLGGFANITLTKQRKLAQLAQTYLQRWPGTYKAVRFDAVEVEFASPGDQRPVVRHLADAFRAS